MKIDSNIIRYMLIGKDIQGNIFYGTYNLNNINNEGKIFNKYCWSSFANFFITKEEAISAYKNLFNTPYFKLMPNNYRTINLEKHTITIETVKIRITNDVNSIGVMK